MSAFDDKLENLERKFAETKERIRKHKKEAKSHLVPEGFTEYRSALFKRKSGSGYDECAYCPSCLIVMGHAAGKLFMCTSCKLTLDLGDSKIAKIIRSVNRQEAI